MFFIKNKHFLEKQSKAWSNLGTNTENPVWEVLVNARQQWVKVVPSWNPRLLERPIHSEVYDEILKDAVGDLKPSFLC